MNETETETETETHTETEISAETETETESFRSLMAANIDQNETYWEPKGLL